VRRAPISRLARLSRQVVLLDLLLGDGYAAECQADVRVQVGPQLALDGNIDQYAGRIVVADVEDQRRPFAMSF